MTGESGGMSSASVPDSYELVLPPGWVHIPLQAGTKEALDRLLFSRLKVLPPEVPKEKGMAYRLKVREEVEEKVAAARDANGIDLYLPVELGGMRYGVPLAASILVTMFVTSDQDPGPEVVLSRLALGTADDADTETMELADTLAVRRSYIRPAAPDRGLPSSARSVEYALAIPNADRRYVAVSFSTIGDGDPSSEFSDALTELFDAVMTTFSWSYESSGAAVKDTFNVDTEGYQ